MISESLVRQHAQQRIAATLALVVTPILLAALCMPFSRPIGAAVFCCSIVGVVATVIYTERIKTICPQCHADVSSRYHWLLATRRCPLCDERIIDGGVVRQSTVYRRFLKIRSRVFLRRWLWAWPLFSIAVLLAFCLKPDLFRSNPMPAILPAFIGTCVAGWVALRTLDKRYAPPLVASGILLLISSWIAMQGW